MFRYEKKFKFENLGIEINTSEYRGSRQTESNPGIDIIIKSQKQSFASGSFRLRSADTFPTKGKKMSELFYASYRAQDIDQAKAINVMIQLYEIVQAKGNETDKDELLNFRNHVEESLKKAFGYDAETAIKPLKFIVPGKRVDENSFELVDTSEYQPGVKPLAEEKKPDVKEFKSSSDFFRATEMADHVASVDGTRSNIVGRVDGIVIEYTGPSPELRQWMERFRRTQHQPSYDDVLNLFSSANAIRVPAPEPSNPEQEDIILTYTKPY